MTEEQGSIEEDHGSGRGGYLSSGVKLHVRESANESMLGNIGMGSLHDHRPGESDGHFVVSKEYQAKGDGSLQVNVGMGSMEIRQD